MSESTKPIADFFDRECCAAVEAGTSRVPGSTGITALLLDALVDAGAKGRTVLELGSGAGELSRELVARGAASVIGIDLSPMSVQSAAAVAAEAGMADRLSYRVGDGALEPLDQYDIVVSQRVVCCYPDPRGLLRNSLPAARDVYALVLPESRGFVGLLIRLAIAGENLFNRLRGERFRAYLHDVREIDAAIGAAGFERRLSRRHWAWRLLVFRRA